MKKQLLLFLWASCFISNAYAQYVRCNTDAHQAALESLNPGLVQQRIAGEQAIQTLLTNNPDYRVGSVVTIPVVFHIIYNNSTQNISDARIYEQLNVMNQDFSRTNLDAVNTRSMFLPVAANSQIQFCLAKQTPQGVATNGILRISSTSSTLPNNPHSISPEWDHTKYLNIYIGNLANGLLGYANFPPGSVGSDHVVILYSSVGGPNVPGTLVPYHLGRTVTHEIGHWLNLHHTFNGGCSGLNNTTCSTGGDQVCDTPPVASSAFGCPTNTPNTCTETAPFPAPYTMDMVNMYENFMDYTDDACMNVFTSGQSARMNAAITLSRSGLINSAGCTPVGLNEILDESFVTVQPNPSSGIFEIQFKFPVNTSVDISIADLKGREIHASKIENSTGGISTIDLSDFADGFYQMTIKTKSGYLVKRIVISR